MSIRMNIEHFLDDAAQLLGNFLEMLSFDSVSRDCQILNFENIS